MDQPQLLTRDSFRETALHRDDYKCVVCGSQDGIHVHHIIERRLWKNGGYYLSNAASVCEEHHLECERTSISVEEIREYAEIKEVVVPSEFEGKRIDKWGNEILSNGSIIPGPLYEDPSVNKILTEGRTKHRKYPRTPYLPFSKKLEEDDLQLEDTSCFDGKKLVISEKLDGENTTMYWNGIHARSLDSEHHDSRTMVKRIWSERVAYQIPEDMRIVGENLQAKHTLEYSNVPVFNVFAIFIHNTILSWFETEEWCALLGLKIVPMISYGKLVMPAFQKMCESGFPSSYRPGELAEGVVIRNVEPFDLSDWNSNIAKYVHSSFTIGPERHWKYRQYTMNDVTID